MCELIHAETAAGSARALRVIEHEKRRADVAIDKMMRRAAQRLVEALGLNLGRALDHLHLQQPVANQQRAGDTRFDRLLVTPAHHEPIHHRVHLAHRRLVDVDLFREIDRAAVDDHVPAPLLADFSEDEVELFAVDREDRRAQLDLRSLRQRQDRVENLARGAAGRRFAGPRTMGFANRREQKVQVARDIGHGADRRAGIGGKRFLLDRNDRRQAEHKVDVGLGDLRDEALGVTRQRLHVAALALGVDGVERQARFPRTGETGDDNQTIARDLDRDVLEIVHARALHRDGRARRLRVAAFQQAHQWPSAGSLR